MTIDIDRYNELKDEVDDAQAAASKAEGALESHMATLLEEFDCETLADSEKLLKRLQEKTETAETEYNEKLTEFEEKWKAFIED